MLHLTTSEIQLTYHSVITRSLKGEYYVKWTFLRFVSCYSVIKNMSRVLLWIIQEYLCNLKIPYSSHFDAVLPASSQLLLFSLKRLPSFEHKLSQCPLAPAPRFSYRAATTPSSSLYYILFNVVLKMTKCLHRRNASLDQGDCPLLLLVFLRRSPKVSFCFVFARHVNKDVFLNGSQFESELKNVTFYI